MASGTFTAAGNSSATISVPALHNATVALSGTFVAKVVLERLVGGSMWQPIETYTGAATTAVQIQPDNVRLRCLSYTSGTATYSITATPRLVVEHRDLARAITASVDSEGLVSIPSLASTVGLSALADGVWVNDITPTFTNATANRFNPDSRAYAAGDGRRRKTITLGTGITKQVDLIEPTRTNLLLQNNDFNTNWTKVRLGTRLVNQVASPDLTVNATKVLEDSNPTNSHYLYQTFVKATNSLPYAFTIYAKKAERSEFEMWLDDGAGSFANHVRAKFNVDYGYVVTRVTGGSGMTLVDAYTEDVGNGWYRCVLVGTTNTTAAVIARISLCDASSNTYSGDGASGIYFWRAQLEQASSPSTPIQTTVAAVARAADVLSCACLGSAASGTLIVYSEPYGHEDTTFAREFIQANGDDDVLSLIANASGTAGKLDMIRGAAAGGDAATSTVAGRYLPGFINQYAISWDVTQVYLHVNGVLKTTTVRTTTSDAITTLLFGASGSEPASWVGAMLWNRRMPTAEILAIRAAYNSANSTSAARAFMCVGDSLTAGTKQNNPYPVQLRALIQPAFVYANANPGDTSTQISTRAQADTQRLGYTTIIWAGRNNFTSPTTVKTDIAAIIAALGHTNYLVLSIVPNAVAGEATGATNRTTMNTLNSDLATLYGTKFLNVLTPLQAASDGSATDTADVTSGWIPTSLRASADTLHLNSTGYTVIANAIAAAITANGY